MIETLLATIHVIDHHLDFLTDVNPGHITTIQAIRTGQMTMHEVIVIAAIFPAAHED